MFDETGVFLSTLGSFFIVGLFFGIFYDIVCFLRIVFGAGKIITFITDFFSVILFSLVVMFFSLELTSGETRLYYFISSGAGVAVYLFTIGFITRFVAKIVKKLSYKLNNFLKKHFLNHIYDFLSSNCRKILGGFVNFYRKITKKAEKTHFRLKNKTPIMYNSRIGKLCTNGGEERNVIKAKVRKKA